VDAVPGVLGEPIRFVLNWGRRYSLWVFNLGLACCAVEFVATSMGRHDFVRLGALPYAQEPAEADVMVVSGTVTDKMAPAIIKLYEHLGGPRYVISFGACSNSGGPYWDSYSVTKGVDQLIPVDVYVPGCPPRPEALLDGIRQLQDKITRDAGRPVQAAPSAALDAAALTAALVPPPGVPVPVRPVP
jgi:NADH-quinone oxidoreductase subunit B